MRGELSLNIKSVYSDNWFVRPTEYSMSNDDNATNDLVMESDIGERLYICGNNDWAFLALELLNPIKKEANRIIELIQERIREDSNIKAVMLGVNDKRIMDVYFGGHDKCKRILGIPVIITNELNKVSFLVEDKELF